MDVLFLSRLQFALTIAFHYLYPPLSIGLGLLLVVIEGLWLKTHRPLYHQMARFWTKVFALTFAIGVATVLATLLGVRRRRSLRVAVAPVLLLGVAVALPAQAADYQIEANRFNPSPFFHDLIGSEKGQTNGGYPWSVGLVLDYQKNPLVLRRVTATGDTKITDIVANRGTANLMAGVRILDWLALGLDVPVLAQGGNGFGPFAAPASFALGDIRLVPRARVLQSEDGKLALALTAATSLPTGKLFDHYTGRNNVSVAPGLLGSWDMAHGGLLLDLAALLGPTDKLANVSLSQAMQARLGGYVVAVPDTLHIVAEVNGATQISAPFASAVLTGAPTLASAALMVG